MFIIVCADDASLNALNAHHSVREQQLHVTTASSTHCFKFKKNDLIKFSSVGTFRQQMPVLMCLCMP